MRWSTVAVVTLGLGSASAAWADGFQGDFAPDQWQSTGILGGTAEVDLLNSDVDTLVFEYDVNLGNPGGGVSGRRASLRAVATGDGPVSLDWEYDFFHAWFQANQALIFFAYDDTGFRHEVVAYQGNTGGSGFASGQLIDMEVWAGQEFGFDVGGGNFDSNSVIRGTVTLTMFTNQDCNGVPGGPATLDECGTCDEDPTNDCVQDCAGTWGGVAVTDECGTCDDDASNDCVQDCNGEWGGRATEDLCGVCDDDPSNDCVEDCNGVLDGPAVLDECGTCDDDPSNDCVQDCNGDWGGAASVDRCGVCDDDPANDCVQDCFGLWGGHAKLDECGVCDHSITNDCVQDCNGDWGGTARINACDLCVGGNTGLELGACVEEEEEATGCGCGVGGAPWSSAWSITWLALIGLVRRRARA